MTADAATAAATSTDAPSVDTIGEPATGVHDVSTELSKDPSDPVADATSGAKISTIHSPADRFTLPTSAAASAAASAASSAASAAASASAASSAASAAADRADNFTLAPSASASITVGVTRQGDFNLPPSASASVVVAGERPVVVAGERPVIVVSSHPDGFKTAPSSSDSVAVAQPAVITPEIGHSEAAVVLFQIQSGGDGVDRSCLPSVDQSRQMDPLDAEEYAHLATISLKFLSIHLDAEEYAHLATISLKFVSAMSPASVNNYISTHLCVSLKDLVDLCEKPEISMIFSRAVKGVELGRKQFKYWYCPECRERFDQSFTFTKHMHHEHTNKISPELRKVIPSVVDTQWVEKSRVWSPLGSCDAIDTTRILERIGKLFDEVLRNGAMTISLINSLVLYALESLKDSTDVMAYILTNSNECIRHLSYKHLLVIHELLKKIAKAIRDIQATDISSTFSYQSTSSTEIDIIIENENILLKLPKRDPEQLIYWIYFESLESDFDSEWEKMEDSSSKVWAAICEENNLIHDLCKEKLQLRDELVTIQDETNAPSTKRKNAIRMKILEVDARIMLSQGKKKIRERELEHLAAFDYINPLKHLVKLCLQMKLERAGRVVVGGKNTRAVQHTDVSHSESIPLLSDCPATTASTPRATTQTTASTPRATTQTTASTPRVTTQTTASMPTIPPTSPRATTQTTASMPTIPATSMAVRRTNPPREAKGKRPATGADKVPQVDPEPRERRCNGHIASSSTSNQHGIGLEGSKGEGKKETTSA